MLKQGNKVEILTKKVGQAPRTGVVVEVRGHWVDVRWSDGRVTTVTENTITRVRRAKK